jgi:hypothetical protein
MRTVIYTNDLEPITVVDLSAFAVRHLEKCRTVRLFVMNPVVFYEDSDAISIPSGKTVTLYAERFVRNGTSNWLMFTNDEESALLLKCAFLAGQQSELNNRERDAFAEGFLYSLSRLGDV